MANTRELRRRIKSVKNTSQITKAMQMVAATKMRRAQNQALAGRPYNETFNFALSKLSDKLDPETHPLLNSNDSENIGIILLSTDKGLCGALNTNIFRATQNFISSTRHPERSEGSKLNSSSSQRWTQNNIYIFYTVGKKGRQFVVKTSKTLEADFENLDIITFSQATQIAKIIVDKFLKKEIREAYIIYPDFVSTLKQDPKIVKLLPIDSSVTLSVSEGPLEDKEQEKSGDSSGPVDHQSDNNDFLFEPNLGELLEYILIHFVETKIYQALLETKASEHSSRMIAMQNATENAKDLVEDLQLTYNQTRQEGITRELLEITTAQVALE